MPALKPVDSVEVGVLGVHWVAGGRGDQDVDNPRLAPAGALLDSKPDRIEVSRPVIICVASGDQADQRLEGVFPAQVGETCKVRVGCIHLDPVADGDRGEMGIRDEISADLAFTNQPAVDLGVPVGRLGNPCGRSLQPRLHLSPRNRRSEWIDDSPWMGRNSQERRETLPRETDAIRTIERLLQPAARAGVKAASRIPCVEEQIGVDQQRAYSASASSRSSASATLETSIFSPSSELSCLNTLAPRFAMSPRLASSLTAAETPMPRSRWSSATAAEISGSKVTVVRMLGD